MSNSLNEEKYISLVKKHRTTNDRILAANTGLSHMTFYRFRKDNPEIEKKSETALERLENIRFDSDNMSMEMFLLLPIIQQYIAMQDKIGVKERTKTRRIRKIYNVSRKMGLHPEKITPEMVGELLLPSKIAYENGEEQPEDLKGLAYTSSRKSLRNWFQLVHGISGERLTLQGLDGAKLKFSGSKAREKVTAAQRKYFQEKGLRNACEKYESELNDIGYTVQQGYDEILGLARFMFLTGTRIGGCANAKLNNSKNQYSENFISINLIDKGDLEWDKKIIDYNCNHLLEFFEKVHGVDRKDVQFLLATKDDNLFPILSNYHDGSHDPMYRVECAIMKEGLRQSGVITDIPNHIWRHTYAQEMLEATAWNYELTAYIGGWESTNTMKEHYGEMSPTAILNGLRKSMKIPVVDQIEKFEW
jgi:hypothetical protein